MGPTPAALAPLAQLLAKPGAINALTSITALSGLQDFLGGLAGMSAGGCGVGGGPGSTGAPQLQTTGVHRMPKGNGNGMGGMSIPRMRHGVPPGNLAAAAMSANGNSMGDKKNDRNKFNPY